jgi:glutathione-regulated potassium-efflux system protein KefB
MEVARRMNLEELIVAAILFFGVGLVFVALAQQLRLGAIFGFLVAGIALGPYSPGPVLTEHVDELIGIGEFGVVLLMFTIGLEMQPNKLWGMRRLLFGLGPSQLIVTGGVLALALSATTSLLPLGAVVVGLGLAMSSTAIAMQVLGEKGEVATDHGKAVFAVLMMQDIASVLLLIGVPLLTMSVPGQDAARPWWEDVGIAIGAIAGIALAGRYLLPLLFSWSARRQSTATFGIVVILAVMLSALVMEKAGLSMAMAGFLLGVILSQSEFRLQVEASVLPLKGVFMALFFVAVGMSIDLRLVMAEATLIAGYVVLVLILKVAVMVILGRSFGLGRAGSWKAAAFLAPCSEFGFVLFATSKATGLIGETGFAIAVVVVSATMAATPFIMALGYSAAHRLAPEATSATAVNKVGEGLQNHIVVAGYGRAGRLMCLMLKKTDTPYIAFDLNPARIRHGQAEGHNVHYGDLADPRMQGTAAFAKAKSVVVTLDDPHAAERLIGELRAFYRETPIQVAAPDLPSQDAMRRLGVAEAICTSVEGSLQLGEAMLRVAGVAEHDIEVLAEALRRNDYALLRESVEASRRGSPEPEVGG